MAQQKKPNRREFLGTSATAAAAAWAGEKEQVIGDEQANALVTKPYRKGWELEV